MDSYRVEKKAVMKIALADEDAEIGPKLFVENSASAASTRSGTDPAASRTAT